MSAWAESTHHTVTVTVEYDGPDDDDPAVEVKFECTAPEDAKCRTYPDCVCEAFHEDPKNPGHDTMGHLYVPGRDCWVKDWFDAGPEGATYAGDDMDECNPNYVPTIAQRGQIEVSFEGDYIEWTWAGNTESLPVIRPVVAGDQPTEPVPDPRWEQTGPDLIDALQDAS